MISYSEFIAFLPSFPQVSLDVFDAAALRGSLLASDHSGVCSESLARLLDSLLVAHILTLQQRAECSGGAGMVKSVSSKEDQIVFLQPTAYNGFEDWLKTTSYGSEYLFYCQTNVAPSAFLV